ncbi:MAG: hypothetical protein KF879_06750 [Saprospiraceae bacterium]|nr:hypothetical protein [Saprospiraceae bacterium]
MHHQGLGIKAIARALDMSKNTVKSYLGKLEIDCKKRVCPMDIEQLINWIIRFWKPNSSQAIQPTKRMTNAIGVSGINFLFVNELKRPGVTRYLLLAGVQTRGRLWIWIFSVLLPLQSISSQHPSHLW